MTSPAITLAALRSCPPLATTRLPGALILLGGAIVALTTPVILLAPAGIGIVVDDAQQFLTLALGIVALSVTAVRSRGEARHVPVILATGLAVIAAGLVLWSLAEGTRVTVSGPAAGMFTAGILSFASVLAWVSVRDMPRARLWPVALQALIVVAAAATLLTALWRQFVDPSGTNQDLTVALFEAIAVVAGPGGTFLVLLDRRLRPGLWGPFALIDGLTLGGIGWLGWQMLVTLGTAQPVSAFDPLISVAVLLVAWAGVGWERVPPPTTPFHAFARTAADAFPIAAVAICVTLVLVVDDQHGGGLVRIGAATVTALTLARQVLLIRSERKTHLAEQASTRRLAREVAHRAAVLTSLGDLAAGDTPEATAVDLCARAIQLNGVEWAIVMALDADGSFRVLAERGPVSLLPPGHRRSPGRSAYLAEQAARGPWLENLDKAADEHLAAMRAAGIRLVASAPLTSGQRVVGAIRLGGSGDNGDEALAERLVAAREFGAVAGALLAPGLDRDAGTHAARAMIQRVIAEVAFHPVYQPIVRLEDGAVEGFEALTRFTDGTRPDLRFAEADLAGVGVDLEIATLAAAVRGASVLPATAYLSLNVSPELACHPSGVAAALAGVDREIVLEVTEHAAVADYADLRNVLSGFGDHVRIAVDDAGAGFAGLQHILEIGPDLVKLDIGLVRGVNQDPARRALIGGMVAFARDTVTTIVAEGIETAAEAETLRDLGVTFGQGYYFGRPAPATFGTPGT